MPNALLSAPSLGAISGMAHLSVAVMSRCIFPQHLILFTINNIYDYWQKLRLMNIPKIPLQFGEHQIECSGHLSLMRVGLQKDKGKDKCLTS